MTRNEAVEWVATRSTEDEIDDEELREAFRALYGRWPDQQDEEEGLYSHCCAAARVYEP